MSSLLATAQTYQSPLIVLLVIFGPSILSVIRKRSSTSASAAASPLPRARLSTGLKAFLLLHTIYHALHLFLPPYDIFTSASLPIVAPNDVLRASLLHIRNFRSGSSSSGALDSPARRIALGVGDELLLARLTTLPNRFLYARYGQTALEGCVWCTSSLDYLVYTLPHSLGAYIGAGIILAILGSINGVGGKDSWTKVGYWILSLAFCLEVGARYTWTLRIVEGDCLHLSPLIFILRHILLMALPILHTLLPRRIRSSRNHAHLIQALSNAQSTLRLTSLLREAITSSPALRGRYTALGERQEVEYAHVRADEGVKEVIQVLERDGEIDKVRDHARGWVMTGWAGLVRVEPDAAGGDGIGADTRRRRS